MSENTIFDLIALKDIYNCELKRARPNDDMQIQELELIENSCYDLSISKTTYGSRQYPCFKVTFWKCGAVNSFKKSIDKLYVRLFLAFPYLFFEINQFPTAHSRTLTFQNGVSYKEKLNRGTLGAKINCETAAEKIYMNKLVGKYKINLDEKTNLYYINAFQKEET